MASGPCLSLSTRRGLRAQIWVLQLEFKKKIRLTKVRVAPKLKVEALIWVPMLESL